MVLFPTNESFDLKVFDLSELRCIFQFREMSGHLALSWHVNILKNKIVIFSINNS